MLGGIFGGVSGGGDMGVLKRGEMEGLGRGRGGGKGGVEEMERKRWRR